MIEEHLEYERVSKKRLESFEQYVAAVEYEKWQMERESQLLADLRSAPDWETMIWHMYDDWTE